MILEVDLNMLANPKIDLNMFLEEDEERTNEKES